MQLQQVCFQDNKSFVLIFNLFYYLLTHTVFKKNFICPLRKKLLCYTEKNLTKFDKVLLSLPSTQSSQNLSLVGKLARKELGQANSLQKS